MQDGIPILRFYRGHFYKWTGTHYRGSPASSQSELYSFLNDAWVQGPKGPAPFNPTKNKVTNIMHALERGWPATAKNDAPFYLQSKEGTLTEVGDHIACQNGILDPTTLELIPHTPTLFNVNCVPFDYDPDAPRPKRRYILREIWPDNEEARLCLQEIFGLMLTPDTKYQKIFLFRGGKRSGKGTIVRVLTALLGKDNIVKVRHSQTWRHSLAWRRSSTSVPQLSRTPASGLTRAASWSGCCRSRVRTH